MKHSILLAVICLLFFSCKKDNDEPRAIIIPGALAKEFFHKQADQVRVFYYNKDSSLNRYEYSIDSVLVERYHFFYFEKQLKSIDFYRRNNDSMSIVHQQFLKYDNRNRLSEIVVAYPPRYDSMQVYSLMIWPYKYVFQYDSESSANFSACVSYRRSNNALVPYGEAHFNYDNRGNISAMEYYDIKNGNKTILFSSVYEYLHQKNPKYRLDDVLDFESYYSPNLWERKTTTAGSSGAVSVYQRNYEFNAQIKMTSFTEQPAGIKRFYEYY